MTSFTNLPQGSRHPQETFSTPGGQYMYDAPLIPPPVPPRFGLSDSQIRSQPELDSKPVTYDVDSATSYPSYALKTPRKPQQEFWGKLFEDDWTPTPLFQKLALALHLHLNLREADNTPLPLAQITGKVAVGKIIFVQMYSGQEQKKANSKLSDIPYVVWVGLLSKLWDHDGVQYTTGTDEGVITDASLDAGNWLIAKTCDVQYDPDSQHQRWNKILEKFELIDPDTKRPFPSPIPRSSFPAAGLRHAKRRRNQIVLDFLQRLVLRHDVILHDLFYSSFTVSGHSKCDECKSAIRGTKLKCAYCYFHNRCEHCYNLGRMQRRNHYRSGRPRPSHPMRFTSRVRSAATNQQSSMNGTLDVEPEPERTSQLGQPTATTVLGHDNSHSLTRCTLPPKVMGKCSGGCNRTIAASAYLCQICPDTILVCGQCEQDSRKLRNDLPPSTIAQSRQSSHPTGPTQRSRIAAMGSSARDTSDLDEDTGPHQIWHELVQPISLGTIRCSTCHVTVQPREIYTCKTCRREHSVSFCTPCAMSAEAARRESQKTAQSQGRRESIPVSQTQPVEPPSNGGGAELPAWTETSENMQAVEEAAMLVSQVLGLIDFTME